MKQRILALLLALGLAVGLTACGPKTPAPDKTVSPSVEPTEAVTPVPDPTEGVSTQQPDVTELPDKGTPPPEADPTQLPGNIVSPDEQPSPTPAEMPAPDPVEPSDTPSIAIPAASTVYDAVSAVTGSGNLSDMSEVMDQFYNISTGDLEDFVFYMPAMNATIEEIFIGRAKPGKADAVKAACQSRLDGLREDGEFYPDTGIYLDGAKVDTSGDWVILAVCDNADSAVKAFKDAVK